MPVATVQCTTQMISVANSLISMTKTQLLLTVPSNMKRNLNLNRETFQWDSLQMK